MRIEDVPPTGSFEYYLGPVHWLDALTPPIEAHLERLTDSVRASRRKLPVAGAICGSVTWPESVDL